MALVTVEPYQIPYFKKCIRCGPANLCEIFNAWGKVFNETFFQKLIGATLSSVLVRHLQDAGFGTIERNTLQSELDKGVEILKEALDSNHPVVLLVAGPPTGYWGVGHWISLWGYDTETSVFYGFDPWPDRKSDQVPIGNREIAREELIKIWKGSLLYRPGGYHYYSVEVIPPDHL